MYLIVAGYLLKRGTTWNDLKRPTMSKKWVETTYNEQETTWNDLKQPRASKKPLTFHLFFKLILNFFDLILFVDDVFNSSSESLWGISSMVARRNFMKAGSVQLSAAPVLI